ncbi:MAG: flagellar export protein FliJ [Pseudomonadota bacterium]
MKHTKKPETVKNTFKLRVVQDLAQQQSDTAATRLGVLHAQAAAAEQKLSMLLEYRAQYHARLRQQMREDLHSAGLKNFHQFMEKLDEAIEQQRSAVLAAREAVQGGQHHWQAKQIKVKAYDTLALRHKVAQSERAQRSDQRIADEFAARTHHSKR